MSLEKSSTKDFCIATLIRKVSYVIFVFPIIASIVRKSYRKKYFVKVQKQKPPTLQSQPTQCAACVSKNPVVQALELQKKKAKYLLEWTQCFLLLTAAYSNLESCIYTMAQDHEILIQIDAALDAYNQLGLLKNKMTPDIQDLRYDQQFANAKHRLIFILRKGYPDAPPPFLNTQKHAALLEAW